MAAPPPRRILALCCADLALDRWRQAQGLAPGAGADALPFALVADTAHGPRLTAANPAARAAGPAPGMLLADARTLCPALAVEQADPAGDLAFLERLARWAQRWGPWSALDPPDGVLVDASAVAHLFGGEERLLADLAARCAARALSVRAAIAPTAGAAWALSRHGPPAAILAPGADIAAALAPLPVAALRLDGDVLLVLRRLGLKRIGQLAGVEEAEAGRDAVRRRFRNRHSPAANPLLRLDQLTGRLPEPLLPVATPAIPLVQRRLMEPIRHRPLLERVLADLAGDLVRLLEGQGQGARRLELGLWRVDGEVLVRRLELAAATRDAAHICRLFTGKLDDVEAGFGIELARLAVPWAQPLALAQADLEAAAEAHGTSLAACIDRLAMRLGEGAIRRPVPRPSHLPERGQGWQPPLAPEPPSQGLLAFHARPLKLLDRAEQIAVIHASPDGHPRRFRWRGEVHEVAKVEGPERIAPEWWRARSTTRLRDYYRVEDGQGRRYWLYRAGLAGDGRGPNPDAPPAWFLHGLCG